MKKILAPASRLLKLFDKKICRDAASYVDDIIEILDNKIISKTEEVKYIKYSSLSLFVFSPTSTLFGMTGIGKYAFGGTDINLYGGLFIMFITAAYTVPTADTIRRLVNQYRDITGDNDGKDDPSRGPLPKLPTIGPTGSIDLYDLLKVPKNSSERIREHV